MILLVAGTSLSFDIATLELLLPLFSGAKLILATRENVRDGDELAQLLDKHQATMFQSTPSGWRLLRSSGWPLSPLTHFKGLSGGEALPKDLAADLRGLGVKLWNGYGPSETTIYSSVKQLINNEPTLGSAIAGTSLYILDSELNLVPTGIAGELFISGVGLARGYERRVDLTSVSFIADPFNEEGGRLYRTGDLVRWNTNNELEYLGRIDHQVKIRGFRIELGEIECELLKQTAVSEAVVVDKASQSGTKLVAYVTASAEKSLDINELKVLLGQSLPDYMVPTIIVLLDALPLNPNGKIDRKALPEPEFVSNNKYQAPEGEIEIQLAQVWSEALGIEQIGRHDNFFSLGGDSLLSMKVVSRWKSLVEPNLYFTLKKFMQSPTISGLLRNNKASSMILMNAANNKVNPLFCIHAGMGTVLGYQGIANKLQGQRSVYGIACRTLIDPLFQDVSLEQMAIDYCIMIKEVQPQGPYNLLGWSLGGPLAFMVSALLEAEKHTVSFLGLVDTFELNQDDFELEDWRTTFIEDLSGVRSIINVENITNQLANVAEPDIDLIREIIEQCPVPDSQKFTYSSIESDDLVAVFMTSYNLELLSSQEVYLPKLRTRSFCWWAQERTNEQKHSVIRQLGHTPEQDFTVPVDHMSIINNDSFLSALVTALTDTECALDAKRSIIA